MLIGVFETNDVEDGYVSRCVNMVMLCVSSILYSIVVNTKLVGLIIPYRGPRQRDLLSSYLFILCGKGLSCLIAKAEARGDLHGIRIFCGAPAISHCLFTDDSLFFHRAIRAECETMKNILIT